MINTVTFSYPMALRKFTTYNTQSQGSFLEDEFEFSSCWKPSQTFGDANPAVIPGPYLRSAKEGAGVQVER